MRRRQTSLAANTLTTFVARIEAGELEAADPLIIDYVLAKLGSRSCFDSIEFHNAVFRALFDLRRELSAQIAFDARSVRESAQLRSLTGEHTVATVKRIVRRALEPARR